MRPGERLLLWPRAVLGGAFALYALAIALREWLRHRFPLAFASGALDGQFSQDRLVLAFAAAFYAVHRVRGFHPLATAGYRRWLTTAPWRWPMPLPLGPLHLVWRDLIVLAPMAALAQFVSHAPAVEPLAAFGIAYLVALAVTIRGAWWWSYGIALGLAGVVRLAPRVEWMTVALIPVYAIAAGGIRQCLKAFPWQKQPTPIPLGWPFDDLAPRVRVRPTPVLHALLYALLAGAWGYTLLAVFPIEPGDRASALVLTSMFGLLVAFCRLMVYIHGSNPAASPMGRLASGRWLLPRYDAVLIGPALVGAASMLLPSALDRLRLPPSVSIGSAAAAITFLVLAAPPTLARWRLTAERRAVFVPDGKKYTQVV